MNDFEVLSRDAESDETETTEKLKLDVCSKFESLRSELFELNDSVNYAKDEITVAFKKFDAAKIYVDRLIAENSKLAKALDEARRVREESVSGDRAVERELRREIADAQRFAERFRTALDAALNDVAIWKRAAFWFGVSSVIAVVVAVAAAF